MGLITFKQFRANTQGKAIAVPWGFAGECVSLVSQYCNQCLGIPMKRRGNARDWDETFVQAGLGTIVKTPRYGDLIVYNVNKYGHMAIYIDAKTMYDQNNATHDNNKAGVAKLIPGGVYVRPHATLLSEAAPAPKPTKTINEIAKEVIKGAWGNGDERKKRIAAAGYNYAAVQAEVNRLLAGPSISYYPAFNNKSIVDGLKSIGVNSSLVHRKNIAKANGITYYTGTPAQNIQLLNLARQGKLRK